MAGKINLGSRTFKAIPSGKLQQASQQSKQGNFLEFEVSFNSLTGAGVSNTSLAFLNPFFVPNECYLKKIQITGYFTDSISVLKTQPIIYAELFRFGLQASLNTTPPNYTLGASSLMNSAVSITGQLNTSPILYQGNLYIPPQSQLVLQATAFYWALTGGTDQLFLTARLVFEK